MESVYQNTFWLAVALLAILLPVYVLAVSLLGRAIGIAKSQERKDRIDQQKRAEVVTAEAKEALAEALDVDRNKELRKQLRRAEKDEKTATKHTRRVGKRYSLLRLWPCVGFPGILLASAAVLSTAACGFGIPSAGIGGQNWLSTLFWSVSVALIAAAVARLFFALQIVQEVSLSSEEEALRRATTAFRQALREVEEEKKPELALNWVEGEPPFTCEAEQELELAYGITLVKGDVAHNVEIRFIVPPDFSVPKKKLVRQPSDHPLFPGYGAYERSIGTFLRGPTYQGSTTVKVGPAAGMFLLYYVLLCEGFRSERLAFSVNVCAPIEGNPESNS